MGNMKFNMLSIEEERVNLMAFVFGILASVGAFIVVVGILDLSLIHISEPTRP